jgi:hypothetical protein
MAPRIPAPTGLARVDALATLSPPTLHDYICAAGEYVRACSPLAPNELGAGPKKAGQIRLSNALAHVLRAELQARLPNMTNPIAGEHTVSGGLREVDADVSESNSLDGLRLAIEIKPVNLSVGRAIWNRFGDVRTFAVNLHLKFPFAVVGGVLAIPVYEEGRIGSGARKGEPFKRSVTHLIDRAVLRLSRAGGRKTEGDAPHLLEGVCVLVYDPATDELSPDLPPPHSGLRWDEFVDDLVAAYDARFPE